jgi:hypothetical protein
MNATRLTLAILAAGVPQIAQCPAQHYTRRRKLLLTPTEVGHAFSLPASQAAHAASRHDQDGRLKRTPRSVSRRRCFAAGGNTQEALHPGLLALRAP